MATKANTTHYCKTVISTKGYYSIDFKNSIHCKEILITYFILLILRTQVFLRDRTQTQFQTKA